MRSVFAPCIDPKCPTKEVDGTIPHMHFGEQEIPMDPAYGKEINVADHQPLAITIPTDDLPRLVSMYIEWIETAKTTRDNCFCQWNIHPEDIHKPIGEQRMGRGDQNPLCPSHTREGFLVGFLNFVLQIQDHEEAQPLISGQMNFRYV
jgi:hypothetical protein